MKWYEIAAIAVAVIAFMYCAYHIWLQSKLKPGRADRKRARVEQRRKALVEDLEPFEWVPPRVMDRLVDPEQRIRAQWDHVQRSFVERVE